MERLRMGRLAWLAVVVSAVVVSGLPAVAQEEPEEKQWGLRLGPWYPADGDVRELTNNWWVYFGLEHFLPGNTSVSLDYGRGSGTISIPPISIKSRVELYSLFYNLRRPIGNSGTSWLVGLGVVYMRAKVAEPALGVAVSDSKTDVGFALGIAQRLGRDGELQLRYQTGWRRGNTGLVLNIGFRF